MASIKEIASAVRETAQDGIGWIALWKRGRSWEALEIWPEECDYDKGTMTLNSDEAAEVRRILAEDPNAIFVNSYYHNLGMCEGERLHTAILARKMRWQYEEGGALLVDWTSISAPSRERSD